ncbi:MAG: radical SAM protein [Methanomassiliicoccales archaeon]|jgi:7-carboxy-7-deazaguanine synthase|nr:radical SAM protein [Methanomassiliicoccales archaeon]
MRISEIFYSLQGEGILIGTPSSFVRTSGCNLRCRWCDTTYAQTGEGVEQTIDEIIEKVKGFGSRYVCITGGEPLLQKDIYKLINKLLENDYEVCVETNGSISIEEMPCSENLVVSMDIKCPSSGMADKMNLENLELLSQSDQLKFVVADRKDMLYAKEIIQKYEIQATIVMTPVGGLDLRPVAEWVLENKLQVRVLPQLHKIIWGDKRGV